MKEIVLSQQEISAICKRLGKEITQALASDKEAPVLCCVMNGAVNFMVDLMREIDVPVLFDYVQVSSWEGTSSTGEVKFIKDLSLDITGRTLVIVEDIVDTGLSMHALLEHIHKTRKPKRILVAALLEFELVVLDLSGLSPGVEAESGAFSLRGERQMPISNDVARCINDPGSEKNMQILVDAARAIGVFYTFHLDSAPEARRTVLRMISNNEEGTGTQNGKD